MDEIRNESKLLLGYKFHGLKLNFLKQTEAPVRVISVSY